MVKGTGIMLKATASPYGAADVFKWTSSNPAIAMVDEDIGEVTAVGAKLGTVTIKAAVQDGTGKNAIVKLKVTN